MNLKGYHDVYVLDEFKNQDLVSVQELLDKIGELSSEVERLQDDINEKQREYEDLEQDLEDNYIHRPMSHYTGDSYDDRF